MALKWEDIEVGDIIEFCRPLPYVFTFYHTGEIVVEKNDFRIKVQRVFIFPDCTNYADPNVIKSIDRDELPNLLRKLTSADIYIESL